MNMISKAIAITSVCIAPALCAHSQEPVKTDHRNEKTDTAHERLVRDIRAVERQMKELTELYSGRTADGPAVKVGDKKDGNIIFWVDGTGKHGLIVYPKDLGIMNWDEGEQACKKLGEGWRMPTKDELDKLYKANKDLNILSSYFLFHSSTTEGVGVVWCQSLRSGNQKTGYKTGTASTCAVRTF